MLYHAYELQRAWLSGASAWASIGAELMTNPRYPAAYMGMGPMAASALEVFAHATQTYGKPAFDIEAVTLDGRSRAVTEAIVYNKPFGDLRRFTRDGLPGDAPKVLIVAPMSGHYATLLRGTVARMVESSSARLSVPASTLDLRPASADASFRHYYRLELDGRSLIVMDASAESASCGPFVAIARLLADGGLNVPAILAEDLARGWLLLGDLGRQTYLDVLDENNADALFAAAIDALVDLQRIPCPSHLPCYDAALLRRIFGREQQNPHEHLFSVR